jgi:hypothetical protein
MAQKLNPPLLVAVDTNVALDFQVLGRSFRDAMRQITGQ